MRIKFPSLKESGIVTQKGKAYYIITSRQRKDRGGAGWDSVKDIVEIGNDIIKEYPRLEWEYANIHIAPEVYLFTVYYPPGEYKTLNTFLDELDDALLVNSARLYC